MRKDITGALFIFAAAVIWGLSGSIQTIGNEYMGVLTFNASRAILGAVCLIPFAYISVKASRKKLNWKKLLKGGIPAGAALCSALTIQQFCLKELMVGKVIFLTSLYVIMVPIMLWPKVGTPGKRFAIALAFVLVGLYILCMKGGRFDFSPPELLMLGCAFANAIMILVIDHYSKEVDCLALTAVECATMAALSIPAMFVFEEPTFAQLTAGWETIFYTGVMSSAVAYSCQALGQKYCEPSVASLLLTLETPCAVIGAWLILSQTMELSEIIGCIFMFIGILIIEIPTKSIRNLSFGINFTKKESKK